MSIQFEVSEVIRTQPERIFDALLDPESAAHWMPGLVRMELLVPGPLKVGSGWKETRKMLGREVTEQFKVVGMD